MNMNTREELVAINDKNFLAFNEKNKMAGEHLVKCFDELLAKIGYDKEFFYAKEVITGRLDRYNCITFYLHDLKDDGIERRWFNFDIRVRIESDKQGNIIPTIAPSIGSYSDGYENKKLRALFIAFGRVIENYDFMMERIKEFDWVGWDKLYGDWIHSRYILEDYDREQAKIDRQLKLDEIANRCGPGVSIVIGTRKSWFENGRSFDEPKTIEIVDTIKSITPKKIRFAASGLVNKETVFTKILDGQYKFASVA